MGPCPHEKCHPRCLHTITINRYKRLQWLLKTSLCEEADNDKKSGAKSQGGVPGPGPGPGPGPVPGKSPAADPIPSPFRTAVSMLLYKVRKSCRVWFHKLHFLLLQKRAILFLTVLSMRSVACIITITTSYYHVVQSKGGVYRLMS